MQLDLPRSGKNRCLDGRVLVAPAGINWLHRLLDVRFRSPRHEQRRPVDALLSCPLLERPRTQFDEHRPQLARGARKQNQDSALILQQLPWRRSVRVVEHCRAAEHHRLAAIDVRHAHAPALEPLSYLLGDRKVFLERKSGHLRDGIASQIVVGRSESTGEDDEIGATKGLRTVLRDRLAIVAVPSW